MMIESVEFKNFKVLRNTTLPLSRFTLIIGPNGSGKSTSMRALQAVSAPQKVGFASVITAGGNLQSEAVVVIVNWDEPFRGRRSIAKWSGHSNTSRPSRKIHLEQDTSEQKQTFKPEQTLHSFRIYSLDPQAIAEPTFIDPNIELAPNGARLAGVLDRLRDHEPERFEALNKELRQWLPEFDRILFDTPSQAHKAIMLRTQRGHYKIPATDLSQGTLIALALLTLAYIPDPPPILCIEEPDRGIHPRLLRDIRDALYRLSYPESVGEA